MKEIIRLGTRGSPLALIQAEIVRDALYSCNNGLKLKCDIEIVPISTSGDWKPSHGEKSFASLGGTKGLFTKEIEEALLDETIDCAVHSMKDVSVFENDNLTYTAILKRDDPRDALLSPLAPKLEDLPTGSRVGTSSLRRKAQILAFRPDLIVTPLRGNVDTRLKKLSEEYVDATILAVAGLSRIGMMDSIASILDTKIMLPAASQGMLGVQIKKNNNNIKELFESINHIPTQICSFAERNVLKALDGSCNTPIGVYSKINNDKIFIEAMAAKEDGTKIIRKEMSGALSDAKEIGYDLGTKIKAELPKGFFCN